MARKKSTSPFDVDLTDDRAKEIADRLCTEIEDAVSARIAIVGEDQAIDKWHELYEGGSGKIAKTTPWPGAADLTSFIGTEKVDAWRARVMQTIFTEPVWTVEGWGESASRAALVEEFHQWKVEEERLQAYLGKVVHNGFVEGTGVLEVAERAQPRVVPRQMKVKPLRMPDGSLLIGEDGRSKPEQGADGEFVPADGDPDAIEIAFEDVVNVGAGPQYRVVGLKDFVVLPGHAADVKDVWGYGKRFWRRYAELEARAKAGVYARVDQLGQVSDRDPRSEDTRAGQTIAPQLGSRVEKELWEVTFLDDLDHDGQEEWYVATVATRDRVLLRLHKLVVGQPTYLLFTPLPRPNSVYGYSLIGHKLSTCIDEHTALRNQITDRSSLVNSAPLKVMQGALWDPQTEPWGPGALITVRDPHEVEAMLIPDVPGSMIERERNVLAAAERVSGLNDVALGVQPQQDRTLGEVNLVATQSFVRMEEAIRYLQEPLEQLFTLRHELWLRALDNGAQKLPPSVIAVLEGRGVQVPPEQINRADLAGLFRGKPRSSVEGADPNRLRANFVGFLNSLANIARAVPAIGMALNTPDAAQAVLREGMRVFSWKERRALMQPNPQMMAQQVPNLLGQQPMMGQQMPMSPMPPMPPQEQ